MKRILLITAALTLFAYSSYAQFFTLGPKVGISSSKIQVKQDVEGIISGDAGVGFHAGLFARVSILGFYVQPEALFTSTRGQIVIDEPGSSTINAVQDLTYNKLDVPVMLGFKIGPLLRLNAGPIFSMLLSNDARTDGTVDEIEQNYKDATVGYQVGVGLDISKITLDLKYENNLSALGESVTIPGVNQPFETDTRNQLIQLSLGYKLF
ncbi:porin family protein [Catalinimonas niigatensis]|uniref:porin family protein n=1 Tax=Catalinimonas niigatensis TaxID=1397264 RepID=UPI002666986E|nr:porin family protein [Catalinimonas niigatensis]WPP49873.1 porin family protein [Catalinimonas niigatensis]